MARTAFLVAITTKLLIIAATLFWNQDEAVAVLLLGRDTQNSPIDPKIW